MLNDYCKYSGVSVHRKTAQETFSSGCGRQSSREELRVIQCFRPGASINKLNMHTLSADFPGGSDGKASTYNAGDPGSIPGLGKPSEEENGNPLQYSCLENPMDRGAW